MLEIEVNVTYGQLPATVVIGLPDAAVKESRDRVKASIKNS
ncbi:MAG: magnesium chelatase domain-containing protein, partial [Candidatus Anammoxibacter sp.]